MSEFSRQLRNARKRAKNVQQQAVVTTTNDRLAIQKRASEEERSRRELEVLERESRGLLDFLDQVGASDLLRQLKRARVMKGTRGPYKRLNLRDFQRPPLAFYFLLKRIEQATYSTHSYEHGTHEVTTFSGYEKDFDTVAYIGAERDSSGVVLVQFFAGLPDTTFSPPALSGDPRVIMQGLKEQLIQFAQSY